MTGADVSVLCADAYAIAQREHIAQLHELAEGLKVQISSLLLFLDAWEARVFEEISGCFGLNEAT